MAVITQALTVKELADRLLLPETEVVKNLFAKGVIKTVNQTIELEVAVECAKSLGYEVVAIDLFRTRLATATREQLREEIVLLRWPG